MSTHAPSPELQAWAATYLPPWADTSEGLAAARAAGHYLSPRLRADPEARLDTATEVQEFVGQWEPDRLRAAEELYEQMRESNPRPIPTDRLRAFAAVPVAYDEHPAIIRRGIATYIPQDMPPDQWAACAVVNPADGRTLGRAIDTVRAAMSDCPFPLYVVGRSYDAPPPMGLVRADGTDPFLYHLASKEIGHRVLNVSNDIDSAGSSKSYFRQLCEAADANPDKDFFTCPTRWELPGGPITAVSKILRYFMAMDTTMRHATPHYSVTEANMAVDAAAIAAVGGFLRDRPTEQMFQLRQTYALARGADSSRPATKREIARARTVLLSDIFLRTASRRMQLAFAKGFGPHEFQSEAAVPFSTGHDAMDRSLPPEAFPTELDPNTQAKLLADIDEFYGSIIKPYAAQRFQAARIMARKMIGLPAAA